MFNTSLLLMDGTILTIIFTAFILTSFLWKPRIWLHDFPADIQEMATPKTDEEKRQTILFAIPFFIVLFGGLGLAAYRYGNANGFLWMTIHIYLIWQIVNVFDLIVLDWGGMLFIDPQNPPIPGTEGAKGYRDFAFHFFAFLKGSVMGLVLVLIVGGIVWLLF